MISPDLPPTSPFLAAVQLSDAEVDALMYEAATPSTAEPRCVPDALSFERLSGVLTSGQVRVPSRPPRP